MATEHEFKFILALDFLQEFNEDTLKDWCESWSNIDQGYLAATETLDLRIRCRQPAYSSAASFVLTFKYNTGVRTIEIEQDIDERDARDLWPFCDRRVCKTRYWFPIGKHVWELDILKQAGRAYFILVEVELPEGSPKPQFLPSFLKKYLVYEVGLTDTRFSNKKLGNVEYATDLYRQIAQGGINGHKG